MNYPEYIYCYFNIEAGIEFLETLKFRLSSISAFNDPFESLFQTSYPLYFLSIHGNTTDETIDDRIRVLKEQEICVCSNFVRNKSQGLRNLIKNIRIGCFSEVWDNILMWGHYARKFTGIVVKFRVSLNDWGNDLCQVEYNDNRISIGSFDTNAFGCGALERQLLKRKSQHWAYEKEWRYIKSLNDCDSDNKGCYKLIEESAINAIYVGCRIKSENCNRIKKIIEEKYHTSIPIMIAIPDSFDYKMRSVSLKNLSYAIDWER